jgi:WXG100 family type VII secretion target
MSEIKLRADEAREMANHIKSETNVARDQMGGLQNHLGNLPDAFTGQTAMAFDSTFHDWKSNSDRMLESLEQLGEFLLQAANTIEDTDAQIASQLGG